MEPDHEGQQQLDLELRFDNAVATGHFNGEELNGPNMMGFVTAEREELKGWFDLIKERVNEQDVRKLLVKMLPGMIAAENFTPTLDYVMGPEIATSLARSLIHLFSSPHTDPDHLISLQLLASLGQCSVNGSTNIFSDPSFDFTPVVLYCQGYLLGNYREVNSDNHTDHGPSTSSTPQIDMCMLLILLLFDTHELSQESELQIVLDRYIHNGKGGILAVMISLKMYFRFGLPGRTETASAVLARDLVKIISESHPGSRSAMMYLALLSRVPDVCDDVARSGLAVLSSSKDNPESDLLLFSLFHNVSLQSGRLFTEAVVEEVITRVARLLRSNTVQHKCAASLGLVTIHSLLLCTETAPKAMQTMYENASVFRSRQTMCQGTQFVITSNFDEDGEPIGEPCSEEDLIDNELHHQLSPIIFIVDELCKRGPSAATPPQTGDSPSRIASLLLSWTRSVLSAALPPSLNLVGVLPALPEPKHFRPSSVSESLIQFEVLDEASKMLHPGDDRELYLRVISCCWGRKPDWSQLRLTAIDH